MPLSPSATELRRLQLEGAHAELRAKAMSVSWSPIIARATNRCCDHAGNRIRPSSRRVARCPQETGVDQHVAENDA
jgi:hypothetical protein